MRDGKDILLPAENLAINALGRKWLSGISEPPAFEALRHDRFQRFSSCAVPSTRDEFWKYTRVAPVLKKTYTCAAPPALPAFQSTTVAGPCIVFVNGFFSAGLSAIHPSRGLVITDIARAKRPEQLPLAGWLKHYAREDYFSLMSDSLHRHGPVIHIKKDWPSAEPLTITHILTGDRNFAALRGFVVLEAGASARIIEQWSVQDSNDSLAVTNTDYVLSENSRLEVNKIQSIGKGNNLISQDFIHLQRSSKADFNTISMEGALIRNNLHADLLGEGAECRLNGLYMARGTQHVDNHTVIRHAVPRCQSHELYKGILNGSSKGVFNGKVMVMPHAQKTNAFQSNANILLTDDAQVYSKPELEIYADDVKCSHGSTTGQLDDEALFYLETRGIGKEGAKNLLLYAFAKEVLDKLSLPQLKSSVDDYISKRYNAHVSD